MFTDDTGEPLFRSRITERRLRRVLKGAALPLIPFRNLRHAAAALMVTAEVKPKGRAADAPDRHGSRNGWAIG